VGGKGCAPRRAQRCLARGRCPCSTSCSTSCVPGCRCTSPRIVLVRPSSRPAGRC
jgi:hypothetical protein